MANLNIKTSIVDFLRSKNLPYDIKSRAGFYEKLGLGTQDEFIQGIKTGETNIKLLRYLQANPSLIDSLAGVEKKDIDLTSKPAELPPQPIPQANDESWASVVQDKVFKKLEENKTTSDDTFLSDIAKTKALIQKGIQELEEYPQPETIETILEKRQKIEEQLEIPKLENEKREIEQAIIQAKNDIRTEIEKSGGFVTESKFQALLSQRISELTPKLELISNQLAKKEAVIEKVMDIYGDSKKDAVARTKALLDYYNKDLDRLLDYEKKRLDISSDVIKLKQQEIEKALTLALKYPQANVSIDDVANLGYAGVYEKVLPFAEQKDKLEANKDFYDLMGSYYEMLRKRASLGKTEETMTAARKLEATYESMLSGFYNGRFSVNDFINLKDNIDEKTYRGFISYVFNRVGTTDEDGRVIGEITKPIIEKAFLTALAQTNNDPERAAELVKRNFGFNNPISGWLFYNRDEALGWLENYKDIVSNKMNEGTIFDRFGEWIMSSWGKINATPNKNLPSDKTKTTTPSGVLEPDDPYFKQLRIYK